MSVFSTMSHKQQVAHLRQIALAVVRKYPIDVERISLIQLSFNAAYRIVATDGRKFALRINVNSQRTVPNLNAEIAWLQSLNAESELTLPRPFAASSGQFVVNEPSQAIGRMLNAVMFEWIDGKVLGEPISKPRAAQIGAVMAELHNHAEGYQLPAGAELPKLNNYLWNQPDRLAGNEKYLGARGLGVIEAARRNSESEIAATWKERSGIAHADLHGWNLIGQKGTVAPIDFDDSAIATTVQDIAVSAYYADEPIAYVDALFEGYSKSRAVPEFTMNQLNGMFVQRNLILLNDVLTYETAEMKQLIPAFLEKSIHRLERYNQTGVFTLKAVE